MFGADMGSLNVAVNNSVVWTMSGNQGSSWKLANVNISVGENSKVSCAWSVSEKSSSIKPEVKNFGNPNILKVSVNKKT